jgi:hypothetical protein
MYNERLSTASFSAFARTVLRKNDCRMDNRAEANMHDFPIGSAMVMVDGGCVEVEG